MEGRHGNNGDVRSDYQLKRTTAKLASDRTSAMNEMHARLTSLEVTAAGDRDAHERNRKG